MVSRHSELCVQDSRLKSRDGLPSAHWGNNGLTPVRNSFLFLLWITSGCGRRWGWGDCFPFLDLLQLGYSKEVGRAFSLKEKREPLRVSSNLCFLEVPCAFLKTGDPLWQVPVTLKKRCSDSLWCVLGERQPANPVTHRTSPSPGHVLQIKFYWHSATLIHQGYYLWYVTPQQPLRQRKCGPKGWNIYRPVL